MTERNVKDRGSGSFFFLKFQKSEVCVSGGSWCDGAVLEDTCPAECEAFGFRLFGTCRCAKAAGEEDRQAYEIRNNCPMLNNFCHKVNCVEAGVLASCSVPVWSTLGTEG